MRDHSSLLDDIDSAPTTALPAPHSAGAGRPVVFPADERRGQAERAWRSDLGLILLHIELDNFSIFASLYGQDLAEQIWRAMYKELTALAGDILPQDGLVMTERLDHGRMIALCALDGRSSDALAEMAAACRLRLGGALKAETRRLTGRDMDMRTGFSLLPGRAASFEDALYVALCDARQAADGALDPGRQRLLEEFRHIVEAPLLTSVYQPIVDLRSASILGWEALIRGPADSHFRSPGTLFDFAEETESIFSLERACRESSIRQLGDPLDDAKLFLNIHPRTLSDPSFSTGATKLLLAEHDLEPSHVVFEITERHSIRDFTLFHRTLEHYRAQGYLVAVDDVGAGYSGLLSIAEIRPDFIKVDMSLVRGVDVSPVKRALLETLVAFSDRIGCRLIAEGIETETEMSSLASMGVHYGQGFFISRPAAPRPVVSSAARSRIAALNRRVSDEFKCSLPLRELTEPACVVNPLVTVAEIKGRLESQAPIGAVVVAQDGRPLGLIMSHHLDRALSTPYGMSLYFHRSVARLMDDAALVLEGGEPVENAAKRAMARDKPKIYDHVIVTESGRVSGVVSVQRMLDALACVQVEMAKGASPLTGLPGNIHIEQELEQRVQAGTPTSFIYVDLDHFKVYNDAYGFRAGDAIILLIARILAWAVKRRGDAQDFIGHVGGDDFVVMTSPDRAEALCRSVTRCFGRLVRGCYAEDDRERRHMFGKDRETGQERHFPLVSVSMAVVDCLGVCDPGEVGRRSAEMKKYVKTIPGNAWARDRRTPLGAPAPDACAPCPDQRAEP